MDNWSINTIQERAANSWSLEGDNQLLNLMKSISKNLEQRCTTTNTNLNQLMLDLDTTKVKLGNATTKLLDLNNAKFVEHTVMDIDSLSNVDKSFIAESDKAFVPLPKAIQEAVTNGLNMMDRCYEKVSLDLEDSDDDDNENVQKHVICRPKNPYINRPLPYLIGSKQWNEKWHVGLIESDEEVLSDEEVEEFSQSSEDGDSISISPQTSNPPTASESDFTAPTPTVMPQNSFFQQLSEDGADNSPLFTSGFHANQEKVKVLPTQVPIENNAISEQVSKSKPLTDPSNSTEEQLKKSIFVQQKSEKTFVNLFDDEPPLLDEPIRNERKPVNLFLDSDDDDDLVPKVNKVPASIFNNNVQNRPVPSVTIPQIDNAQREDFSKNLFHDDVDNNNVPVLTRSETKPTLKSTDFGTLFDDEPPDDFFDIIVKDKGRKVGATQNFDNKKSDTPKIQRKTVNLFESDDDDDDDFSKIIGTSRKNNFTEPLVIPKVKDNIVANTNTEGTFSNAVLKEEPKNTPLQDTSSPYNSPYRSNVNTGPPKSYVSFLDDEPPNFDEEKSDRISSASPIKSFTSNDNLFDKPSPPANKIAPSFTPVNDNLFEKPSPSTENIAPSVTPAPVSLSTKIIYDDIAETLTSSASSKSTLSNESKPTVPLRIQTKSIDEPAQDETDQSLSFKKNLSMFSNPDLGRLPKPIVSEHKPKPNKLKTNFNINVSALLPGAKLPSQKHSSSVPTSQDQSERVVVQQNENVEKKPSPGRDDSKDPLTDVDETSERLACLSKSRAKIQVQRRPSTRRGRQRLYSKTLIEENENVVDLIQSVESTDNAVDGIEATPSLERIPVDISPENTPRIEVDSDNELGETTTNDQKFAENISSENTQRTVVDSDDWLAEATSNDQKLPLASSSLSADEDDEDWLKNIDEKPSYSITTEVNVGDEWLPSTSNTAPKSTNQNVSHVMNYDWLTASNVPPEDINPPSNNSVDDYHDQDDWLTATYATKEKTSIVADLPNDDDDWLTSIVAKQPRQSNEGIFSDGNTGKEDDWLSTTSPSKFVSTSAPIKHEEDDDDWLTQSLRPQKLSKSDISKPSASVVVNQRPPKLDFVARTSEIVETKALKKQSLNSGLFDDDDDDGDLFSSIGKQKSKSKTEAVKSTKNVSTKTTEKSLFSDEDDSDADDLFGSSRSKTKSMENPTQNNQRILGDRLKVVSSDKPLGGGGLFDDEDGDDDDIFSSKIQKPRVGQTDRNKKVSTTKLVSTIPASNDPLADLLK